MGKVEQLRQKFIGYRLFNQGDSRRLSPFPTPNVAKSFDFNSLILASQAISRETQVEALLASLMNILLENSGAQNIYYLTEQNGACSVMAECRAEGETVVSQMGLPEAAARIPVKIVNYVSRAREAVVLDNAAESETYSGDEYIAANCCKSVMCIPVVNKGELKGLLYFENNLIEGAFDEQRIDALKTIASQFAISLENAYLFNNLQLLVDERTRELREEIAVRKDAEKRLEQMANCDMLTKLSNRRMFYSCLAHSIERSLLNGSSLAVLFIDLDGFKAINDKHGHDKGDAVLIATAQRLVEAVRGGDTVSRLGGDEFVLILENVRTIAEIEKVCGRIIASVEQPIEFDGAEDAAVVTSSIGVSLLRVDGMAAEELISRADSAMYLAKKKGKNQFVFSAEDYKTKLPRR
jgi:diguanylate cyclase (GGDEF)-like protein